jgi:hypothetical protein
VTATTELPAGATEMNLPVYQGMAGEPAPHDYLGSVVLSGIPATTQPRQCELQFTLNAECLLNVRVKVPGSDIDRDLALSTDPALVDPSGVPNRGRHIRHVTAPIVIDTTRSAKSHAEEAKKVDNVLRAALGEQKPIVQGRGPFAWIRNAIERRRANKRG